MVHSKHNEIEYKTKNGGYAWAEYCGRFSLDGFVSILPKWSIYYTFQGPIWFETDMAALRPSRIKATARTLPVVLINMAEKASSMILFSIQTGNIEQHSEEIMDIICQPVGKVKLTCKLFIMVIIIYFIKIYQS